MDMSSLSRGLPRPAEDPTNVAFKEAALSLTNLYKASQGARREGYLDAIDEIYTLFIKDAKSESGAETSRLTRWIEDRRRREESPTTQETNEAQDCFHTASVPSQPDLFPQRDQTESLLASSPIRPRHRMSSPVHRHHLRAESHTDETERRENGGRERDRLNGVKRRVVGAVDVLPDLHKRGRFG